MAYCCINQHQTDTDKLWCSACKSLVAGARIHDYSITSYIGHGSFSTVYLAQQKSLNNRWVVIKVLRQTESQPSVRDFRREAAVLAALSHPYILPIYAYGVIEERQSIMESYSPYLVLPYAEEGSLAEAFVREGKLPWSLKRVSTIVQDVAEALEYAHEQGILHRDIKPANLLVMGSHVVLADFGVASLIDDDVSHLDAAWAGSPAYMAPEVWRFRPGRYSDQYALAVTCFRLLTGESLWSELSIGSTRQWSRLHCSVAPRSLHSCRPDLPSSVDAVIQRALAKDPHERYPSVTEFAADLFAASQEETHVYIPHQSVPATSKPPAIDGPTVANNPLLTSKPAAVTAVRPAPLVLQMDAKKQKQADRQHLADSTTAASTWPEKLQEGRYRHFVDIVTSPLLTFKDNDHFLWYALVLNLVICLVLAAQAALASNKVAIAADMLFVLWPALWLGPLVACWFRRVPWVSLSWGVFWGMLFGIANTCLSTLICFSWAVIVILIQQGGGWPAIVSIALGRLQVALGLVLLGLWISVLGGSLIGLLQARGFLKVEGS